MVMVCVYFGDTNVMQAPRDEVSKRVQNIKSARRAHRESHKWEAHRAYILSEVM